MQIALSDNTFVKHTKNGNEYFKIVFTSCVDEFYPYEVSLCRYCVPGRCDFYHFGLLSDSKIDFCSDMNTNLPKALELLHKDLDKQEVINLIVKSCAEHRYHASRLITFLSQLYPNSKATRAVKRQYKKVLAKWDKENENAIHS